MQIRRRALLGTSRSGDDESGIAMVLAIMLILVISTITAAIMMSVVMGTRHSGTTRDYTYHTLAADAALQDAMNFANSRSLPDGITALREHEGATNARRGVFSPDNHSGADIHWQWYVEEIPVTTPYSEYIIYASGYREGQLEANSAVHVRADLHSFPYARVESGPPPTYHIPYATAYRLGAYGHSSVQLRGGSNILLYNSALSTTPPSDSRTSAVHAGGSITYVDYEGRHAGVVLYGLGPAEVPADRCEGADGCLISATGNGYRYSVMSYELLRNPVGLDWHTGPDADDHVCSDSDYVDYTASVDGSNVQLQTGKYYLCINDFTADADVRFPNSIPGGGLIATGTPLLVFVNGDFNVSPGVTVSNIDRFMPARGPGATRFIVNGDVNVRGNTGSTPTSVEGYLLAPRSQCAIGQPGSVRAEWRGAVVCNDLAIDGDSTIYVDQQVMQTENELDPAQYPRAWSYRNYNILSSLP